MRAADADELPAGAFRRVHARGALVADPDDADDAAERDERRGDRHARGGSCAARPVRPRVLSARACSGGRPCTSGRPSGSRLACADGGARRGAERRSPTDGWSRSAANEPAIAAPTAAVPSRPATRAIALLTPEAIPACEVSAPASTAAVSGATVIDSPSANTSSAGQHFGEVVDVHADALEQQQPARRHERPGAHEQARAEAVGERAEAAREDEHHERHRQRREAALAAACSRRSAAGTARGRRTGSRGPRTSRTSRRCPAEKLRRRNSPSGSIGSRARDSYSRNATSSATPAISGTSTAGLDQPSRGCSISANTGPPRPSAHSSAPVQVDAGARRACAAPARGITMQDQRDAGDHERDVDQEDPAPRARSRAARRRRAARARRRSRPTPSSVPIARAALVLGERVDDHRERARHEQRAGDALQRARGHQHADLGASAHSSEATPKPPTPIAKIRRSPNRSPSEPPIRISEPSVSR